MKIIGLAGAAGSGKDTVCGFILKWCEEHALSAERLAFADPLKLSAARSLGFEGTAEEAVAFCNEIKTGTEIVGYKETLPAETGPNDPHPAEHELLVKLSGREFLQRFGTEGHRDVFGPDFWVEVTERRLAERAGALDVVVLTDCRFPNEARMINHHEGEVWEVVRPGLEKVEAHASEAGLPDGAIEFEIVNAGDLVDLQILAIAVCEANLA